MVIIVHSCEFYYIGGETGIKIDSQFNAIWVCLIDGMMRSAVPLFILISGYLLLPVTTSMGTFYTKRLKRVIIPFVIWSVIYMALPLILGRTSADDTLHTFVRQLTNFTDATGHMWFIYMLAGLYLFMPVISPWLEKASKNDLLIFIALWFVSTCFRYLRIPCGEIFGECFWNEFHTLWYFSGFIGYLVTAYYIRKYVNWSVKKSLSICLPLFIAGYAITAGVWYYRIPIVQWLPELELSWYFCTPNVAMMAIAIFIMVRNIDPSNWKIYPFIKRVSVLSYGIYLMHVLVLNEVQPLISGHFSTPVEIIVMASITLALCIAITQILSYLPYGNMVVGAKRAPLFGK